MKLWCTVL